MFIKAKMLYNNFRPNTTNRNYFKGFVLFFK